MTARSEVAIVGGGIAGLTLALALDEVGISCRVYEAARRFGEVGVGINVLPHAGRVLAGLGLQPALEAVAVQTQEAAYYNRFGQEIYTEPLGVAAGHRWPQFSIHRGDLHEVLANAVRDRLGADAVLLGHRCVGVHQDQRAAYLDLVSHDGRSHGSEEAGLVVGCDGIHSVVRRFLHAGEGAPRYSGVHMWRGVTVAEPFLSGATMLRAGWLATGKLVAYPIRNDVDAQGRQLINWVVEVEQDRPQERDWNREGDVADFLPHFEDWIFPWLDVPALFRGSEVVLEYPMVDQDPLDHWTSGRVTLMGDAAHPMVPRGSNGAGQAILDARCLADCLVRTDPQDAVHAYEAQRRPATAKVVEMNRRDPPDAILREVYERTGDRPFDDVEEVLTAEEARRFTQRYASVAGYDLDTTG